MIILGNVVHQSGTDPAHPVWDTMIALHNRNPFPVTAEIRIYREQDGSLVKFAYGVDHFRIVLESNLTWAASFIPDNGFGPRPPQDFRGHAIVDYVLPTPFSPVPDAGSILSFALAAAAAWSYGVNLPVNSSRIVPPLPFRFPYCIPHYDDSMGATGKRWVTGICLQNPADYLVNATLHYTIAQTYPEKGQMFSFGCSIEAHHGLRFDLMAGGPGAAGLAASGYPPELNSEGHLVIDEPLGLLIPSLIIASDDYSFMVGEEPW